MRKPYRWRRGPLPRIDADLIKERPAWAVQIGELTANWNVLEASASGIFMVLLAGEDEGAFSIYYEVLKQPTRATREKIFTAVAKARNMPDIFMDALIKLWDEIAAVEERRNEVVHALWASIEGKPDSLFIVKSRFEWLRNSNAVFTVNLARARSYTSYVVPEDLSTITEFYEYTIADIQEISAEAVALTVRVREMHDKIASRLFALPVEPPWTRAESIVRHLDRENERRRNAAAKPLN